MSHLAILLWFSAVRPVPRPARGLAVACVGAVTIIAVLRLLGYVGVDEPAPSVG